MQATLDFLTELAQNNSRDWFQTHKKRYEASKAVVLNLCAEVVQQLAKHSPDLGDVNPSKCVFRIYRDTRFSKDKTPYKTNIGFWIAPGSKEQSRAGYYLHIQPGASFFAAGVYMPPAPALQAIRQELHFNHEQLRKILQQPAIQSTFGEMEDMRLKSMPRGIDKAHPAADLLRYTSFVLVAPLNDADLSKKNFAQSLVQNFLKAKDFVDFLNQAIGMSEDA